MAPLLPPPKISNFAVQKLAQSVGSCQTSYCWSQSFHFRHPCAASKYESRKLQPSSCIEIRKAALRVRSSFGVAKASRHKQTCVSFRRKSKVDPQKTEEPLLILRSMMRRTPSEPSKSSPQIAPLWILNFRVPGGPRQVDLLRILTC